MVSKREAGLVVLGVVLHSAYMLSIFDIYFKTPIVHGMDPVFPRIDPPAKRLVLFIGTFFCLSLCLFELVTLLEDLIYASNAKHIDRSC